MNKAILISFFLIFYCFIGYSQTDSTFYQKGIAKAQDDKFIEAIQLFTKAMEDNREDPYAVYNRGLCYSLIDKNDSAIADFSRAIELEPSYKKAYLNRGISKRKLLDFEGAQADYKLAIIKAPDYAEAYYHRGYVYELLQVKDSACHFYSIAAGFGLKNIENKLDICADKDKNFERHILQLKEYAASKDYGFSSDNPVKVGGSPTNQREYLNLLRDAQGNPISYRRAGSCCMYKLPSAALGMAMLDKYIIQYRDENNLEKSVEVFISFYEYEEPKILFGFKTVKSR